MKSDTYVIVPVYNKAPVVRAVIDEVTANFRNVICVDDGSTDHSLEELQKTSAVILQHSRNSGQGAALRTGLIHALTDKNAQHFITFDADGQHRTIDALRLVGELQNGTADIVLGSRFLGSAEGISSLKKSFLRLAILFTNMTTGLNLTDTHNGLRAFNRRFAESLQIKCNGMAHASEIIYRIREGNFNYKEKPVTILYTDYSKANGQSVFNSFGILKELLSYKLLRSSKS